MALKTLRDLPRADYNFDAVVADGTLPSVLAEAATEHGPILRRDMSEGPYAGNTFVFMIGPEANRFVLHTHRDHFSHARGWTPIIGEDLGRGLLNMDDPEHAVHRRMWNPAFTQSYMAAYLPLMERVIASRTANWAARESVDVFHESREIAFDVAAGALAGFEPGPQVDRLRELFYTLLHGFDEAHDSWAEFLSRRNAARSELMRMLLRLIAERRAVPPSDTPRDVLSLIVHARDEDGNALSDEQVLAHLNILLVAGHETTTTLGAWTLYLLAAQEGYRRRVLDELESLPDGPITIETIRATKFLDLFIREAGRLYSPVLNVPRGVVRDFEFNGYQIPAGTNVRLALAASHRLPHVFRDPDTFDPDRFAPPREEDRRTPYSLVTFGGGPRICIGINFANIEVKALAITALRSFDLEPVPDQPLTHVGYWTAVVPGGLHLRARRNDQ
jgi:retinoid hydroxylase